MIKVGETLTIDAMDKEIWDMFECDTVVATFNEDGTNVTVWTPYTSSKVTLKVVWHDQWDKMRVVKFQSKKRYQRTIGFRPKLTILSVESIA
jgi:ribosomal protein L21